MKKLFVFLAMVAGAGFIFASEQDGNYDCHKVGQLYYNLRWSGVGGTAEVTIPDDSWASNPYKNIKDLVIPDFVQDVYNSHSYSVQGIAGSTFYNCSWFTSLSLPSGVMSYIGDMAFYGCTGLSSFTFPAGLTSIGEGAFMSCSNLETVTINAESLESYGSGAFEGTAECLKIYVPAGSVDTYKAGWAAYADKIVAISDPTPTAVENVQTNEVQATKFFRDGQILILRDGRTYTLTGQAVK